ncbi:hypothetical protein QF047_001125 [Arthrobacter sp. W4I7]|nr:hypothetical protein [Arthrobacter sp. W4I7]
MLSQGTDISRAIKIRKIKFVVSSLASMLLSVVAYWCLHVLPLATSRDFGWTNFRRYFDHDQYAYLAIAVNVSNGNLDNVEPFTETGTSHYPRLYYVLLGHLARLFDADVIAVWQIVGIALQLAMVLTVSWLLIRLTGSALLGLFGFVPSNFGVLAAPISGSWLHRLENHGVLWGPYGTTFTLNGEAAGMTVAVVAACLLIGFTFPGSRVGAGLGRHARAAVVIGACSAVGMLANVQTYSFLTAVYFLSYTAAAYGLLKAGKRKYAIISAALLIVVLLVGHSIAEVLGPLAALVCGLAGAVPGTLLLLKRHPVVVGASAVGLAAAAAPTILATLAGISQRDPFLEYRALSSENLGVPFPLGIIAAAVPALLLWTIFRAGIRSGNPVWLALSIGIAVAWPIIATNDAWGANQEPYRLWLDGFFLASAVSLPVLGQVLVRNAEGQKSSKSTEASLPASTPAVSGESAEELQPSQLKSPLLTKVGGILLWGVVSLSFLDYVGFAYFVHNQGTASFEDGQARAISATADQLSDRGVGSVLPDPCIDPFRLKTLTGAPTAYYNLGLAWPTNEPSYRTLLEERENGVLDLQLAELAGVDYVMTDSGCEADWQGQVIGSVVGESAYSNGASSETVTLWKLGR